MLVNQYILCGHWAAFVPISKGKKGKVFHVQVQCTSGEKSYSLELYLM